MERDLFISYTTTLVAFITAFIGITLQVFAFRDSTTVRERKQKTVWLFYFCALFMVWLYFFLHLMLPHNEVYTGAPCVLSLLAVPVLVCHAVYIATSGTPGGFSLMHYFIPVVYFLGYCIWTPLVPPEVSEGLIRTGPTFVFKLYPGYEAYSIATGSIAVMRGILSIVYGVAAFSMVLRYYRGMVPGKKSLAWLRLYLLITGIPLLNGILTAIAPSGGRIGVALLAVTSLFIFGQMIVIISLSFDRYSLLFYTFDLVKEPSRNILLLRERQEVPESGRKHKIPITGERFEAYYIEAKRYLEPDIRLTDLLEPLDTNRTTLSGFINRTYGMSFSRLTAGLRLREMERLMELPENRKATVGSLVTRAGFSSEGAYYLARRNQRSGMSGKSNQPTGKKKDDGLS